MSRRTRELTVDELRQAIACGPEQLLAILTEERSRGNVERVDGDRWRLTRCAEETHGRALRGLESA